jgi:lipopolysaccharide/colanic/teichoic acid biosynthesis glycosyltransferase
LLLAVSANRIVSHLPPFAVSPLARDRTFYYFFKRALDLTLAALALVVLLPFMALIAVLITIDSPGPIFYVQKRVGARRWSRAGYSYWKLNTFNFYKFRTMVCSADPSLHQAFVTAFIEGRVERPNPNCAEYKLTRDPRVTRIGRILRKTSLDELPQFLNVLKGDMSLVGPRPALPYEVDLYQDCHKCRFQIYSGITGWWQVKERSRVSFDEMCRLDSYYIAHASLALDFKILLLTPWAVISGRVSPG